MQNRSKRIISLWKPKSRRFTTKPYERTLYTQHRVTNYIAGKNCQLITVSGLQEDYGYRGFRLTDVFDSSESMNMDISTSWPFVTCFKNAIKTNEKIFHLQFESESTALVFCAKLLHCLLEIKTPGSFSSKGLAFLGFSPQIRDWKHQFSQRSRFFRK